MQSPKEAEPVRLQLTEAQRTEIRRLLGRDAEHLELRVEELEERIAPKLAANHNERWLAGG
jgi:hypothetical protein